MILLAEITPEIPWSQTLFVAGGIFALLILGIAVMQFALLWKKLFGKQPPMHQQIADLRDEFIREIARHEADVKSWLNEHGEEDDAEVKRLEGAIAFVDRDVKEFRAEVVRNGDIRKRDIENKVDDTRKELKTDITSVRSDLQEQTNELLRAIGRIEGRTS